MAKFRVILDGGEPHEFRSEQAAYDFIHGEGRDQCRLLARVYVDEGSGWRRYETLTAEELGR